MGGAERASADRRPPLTLGTPSQGGLEDDPQLKGDPPHAWPFVPFSGGTGICPGRNLVLLLTSGMLAALIGNRTVHMKEPQRLPPERLPGTLDNYSLRFTLAA
jgi:hypothetical protein